MISAMRKNESRYFKKKIEIARSVTMSLRESSQNIVAPRRVAAQESSRKEHEIGK